jgi:hypothetical protein
MHVFLVWKSAECRLYYTTDTFIPGKFQKKYKRTKRALDDARGACEPAEKKLFLRPTGLTHGRGNYNLAEDLLENSKVTKEEYNTFVV